MQGKLGTIRAFGENLMVLNRRNYSNGRMAIELISVGGEPWATLSVNLPDAPEPPKGCFYAKTWSENEPLREPALTSGLFEDTGLRVLTGYVQAEVWRLVEKPVLCNL